MGGEDLAAMHAEEVHVVGFRDEAVLVEHDGGISASEVGFDFGQDVVQQVIVVDFGIEEGWAVAAHGRSDQGNVLRINGGFPLCQHDEGTTRLVEAGVHAGGYFLAPGEGEADVHAIVHAVGLEGIEDSLCNGGAARHLLESQDVSRVLQALQVALQAEDAAVVNPQAFPDGIATLHGTVKYGNAGFLPGVEPTVDMDEDIVVFSVVLL